MKHALIIILLLSARLLMAESPFPFTPPSEDQPAHDSIAQQELGSLVLDYGHPNVYGRSTNYWIASSGLVHTQAFKRREDGKQGETRYKYKLSADQLKRLQALLESLRKDSRVLRERYGHPGEPAPILAFSLLPRSDLYVREKWRGDRWLHFTSVTRFLSDVHRAKIAKLKPDYLGVWDLGEEIWEPSGFPELKMIYALRYIGSDRYNAILEQADNSTQGGGRQPAPPEGKEEPGTKVEGRSQ